MIFYKIFFIGFLLWFIKTNSYYCKTGFMCVFFWLLIVHNCRPGPNSPYVGWVGGLAAQKVGRPSLVDISPPWTDLAKQKHNNYLHAVRISRPICNILVLQVGLPIFWTPSSPLGPAARGLFLRGWPKAHQKRFASTFVGGDLTLPRKGGPKINLAPLCK